MANNSPHSRSFIDRATKDKTAPTQVASIASPFSSTTATSSGSSAVDWTATLAGLEERHARTLAELEKRQGNRMAQLEERLAIAERTATDIAGQLREMR